MENKRQIYILLIILKLVLVFNFLPYLRGGYRFDDILYLNLSNNLINFNYLGAYSELTLIKGIGYPIFVAFVNFLHMPYLLGFNMFYVLICLYFVNSLKLIKLNGNSRLIIFAILLFNPIIFSKEIMLLFYRNGFNTILSLAFIGTLINVYYKPLFKNYLVTSFTYFYLMITREDFIWLLPALIITFILINDKLINKIIVPFVITFLLLTLALINYLFYQSFLVNEMSFSQFSNTYSIISKVNDIDGGTLDLRERVRLASENSESFSLIYDKLLKYRLLEDNLYQPSYIFWGIRQATGELDYFNSYKESSAFFLKIENDLIEAAKDNKIKIDSGLSFVVATNVTPLNMRLLFEYINEAAFNAITYKDIVIGNGFTDNSKNGDTLQKVTGQKILSFKESFEYNRFNIKLLEFIKKIYSFTSFIILITGIFSYSYFMRIKKDIFVETILLGSTICLIVGVAYFTVTSYPAISYYYLATAYVFINLFGVVSCIRLYIYLKENGSITRIIKKFHLLKSNISKKNS